MSSIASVREDIIQTLVTCLPEPLVPFYEPREVTIRTKFRIDAMDPFTMVSFVIYKTSQTTNFRHLHLLHYSDFFRLLWLPHVPGSPNLFDYHLLLHSGQSQLYTLYSSSDFYLLHPTVGIALLPQTRDAKRSLTQRLLADPS